MIVPWQMAIIAARNHHFDSNYVAIMMIVPSHQNHSYLYVISALALGFHHSAICQLFLIELTDPMGPNPAQQLGSEQPITVAITDLKYAPIMMISCTCAPFAVGHTVQLLLVIVLVATVTNHEQS